MGFGLGAIERPTWSGQRFELTVRVAAVRRSAPAIYVETSALVCIDALLPGTVELDADLDAAIHGLRAALVVDAELEHVAIAKGKGSTLGVGSAEANSPEKRARRAAAVPDQDAPVRLCPDLGMRSADHFGAKGRRIGRGFFSLVVPADPERGGAGNELSLDGLEGERPRHRIEMGDEPQRRHSGLGRRRRGRQRI